MIDKPKTWMACPVCGKQSPMPDPDQGLYESGWNSALEMVAHRLTYDFKHAFGEDTLASIASWIKGQKK